MNSLMQSHRSALDSATPFFVQNWLLAFSCDARERDKISDTLAKGLDLTVKQFPILGGHVSREVEDDKNLRDRVVVQHHRSPPNGSVQLHVEQLKHHDHLQSRENGFLSYDARCRRGMPVHDLPLENLWSRVDEEQQRQQQQTTSVMSAQANFMDGGGCFLAIRIHHSVFDGFGAAQVVGSWARGCREALRGEDGTPVASAAAAAANRAGSISPPGLELQPADLVIPSLFERDSTVNSAASWRLLGLQDPESQQQQQQQQQKQTSHFAEGGPEPSQPSNLPSAIFRTTDAMVIELQDRARARSENRWLSRFDVLAALLWRCIVRARTPELSARTTVQKGGVTESETEAGPEDSLQQSRLRIPTSFRTTTQISASYAGNAVVHTVLEAPLQSLTSNELRLDELASMISSAKQQARAPASVASAIRAAHSLPSPALRRPLFTDQSRADVVITSWRELPVCALDWGDTFGACGSRRPDFLRIPRYQGRGVCIILPRRADGEVIEVLVSSTQAQLDRLVHDAEFSAIFRSTYTPGI